MFFYVKGTTLLCVLHIIHKQLYILLQLLNETKDYYQLIYFHGILKPILSYIIKKK